MGPVLFWRRKSLVATLERVTGTDVFIGLNTTLEREGGASCFFLGSTEATLEKIVQRMRIDFPHVRVAGTYSPPFKTEFDDNDNNQMIEAINAVKPDVLWVGIMGGYLDYEFA